MKVKFYDDSFGFIEFDLMTNKLENFAKRLKKGEFELPKYVESVLIDSRKYDIDLINIDESGPTVDYCTIKIYPDCTDDFYLLFSFDGWCNGFFEIGFVIGEDGKLEPATGNMEILNYD